MFIARHTKQLVATDPSHGWVGQTGSGTSQLEEFSRRTLLEASSYPAEATITK